jgi:hypothetical protein
VNSHATPIANHTEPGENVIAFDSSVGEGRKLQTAGTKTGNKFTGDGSIRFPADVLADLP